MLQGPVVLGLPGRQAWSPVIDGYTTRRYTDPQTFSTEPVWGGGLIILPWFLILYQREGHCEIVLPIVVCENAVRIIHSRHTIVARGAELVHSTASTTPRSSGRREFVCDPGVAPHPVWIEPTPHTVP